MYILHAADVLLKLFGWFPTIPSMKTKEIASYKAAEH